MHVARFVFGFKEFDLVDDLRDRFGSEAFHIALKMIAKVHRPSSNRVWRGKVE